MKLRSYQEAAVDGIFEAWRSARSTLLVQPTGTGKTVTFAHVINRMPMGRALVLAHREELIVQAADKIARVTGAKPDTEMAEMRADHGMFGKARVVVSSIQTQCAGRNGDTRMKRFDPQEFGLLVVDEAHHATAPTYRRVLEHYGQNQDLKILGVTATPDRHDEEALGQVFDSVAFDYELLDAIRDGWLVPIHQRSVVVDGLDYSGVRTTAGDLNGADLARVMEYEETLHGIAHPTVELAAGRKALVFAASVAHAERLCEIFNRHSTGCARFVTGTTPKDERRGMLADYAAGKFQMLVNVGVATEGFDEPGIQVVVMARPTKSRALYAQMAGRGTRALPGLVDAHEAADARRAAIAASAKPACIAEGQRVLTDRGLVPIENVTTEMLVWDGIAFVSHDGATCQGEREVIHYAGLIATADHRVWTEEGWKTFGQCAAEQVAIGVAGAGRTTIREVDGRFRRGSSGEGKAAPVGGMLNMWSAVAERLRQSDAEKGGVSPVRAAAARAALACQTMHSGQVQMHQSARQPLSGLWRTRDRVSVCQALGDGYMDTSEFRATSRTDHRPHQQRRPLRTGKPAVGQSFGPTVESTSTLSRVWDILNAGPHHRFTVEGLLVSNCHIIDFVGNSGRHKLITTADILGGNYSDEVVDRARKAAEIADGAAVDMAELLADAEKDLAEERERARRAALRVKARYTSQVVDPFDVLHIEPWRERGWDTGRQPSEKMLALLDRNGIDTKGLTFTQAKQLVGEIIHRYEEKQCSFKQARLLSRYGYPTDVPFAEASRLIDALAKNNWQRPVDTPAAPVEVY